MRTLSFNLMLLFVFFGAATSFAQNTRAEQEVLKVNSDYDKAILARDLSFHEKLLAPEFIAYNPDGSSKSRSEVLEGLKKQKAAPTFKTTAVTSDDVKVKVSGNLAVVTGAWKTTSSSMEADAVPRTEQGRYTVVYEKRDGRWLLVTDHATEKTHTAEELEPGLRKASDDFDKAFEAKDGAMFERLLADDFTHTNVLGRVTNKKEEIAHMTSPDLVFTSNKAEDKKFRIHRNSAVETGRYSAAGTYKGKPFSETGRYTTTWFYKNGKWQMAADHASVIPEKNTTGSGAGN
jgi:uncharacterized protein (TIGR02246 family)